VSGESGSSRRARLYGKDHLGSTTLFSGDFVNFGYWKDFTPGRHLDIGRRTESQAELYRTVLGRLKITPADVALEIGCGMGVGAALALREYDLSAVHGLDLSPDQLDRARRTTAGLVPEQRGRLVLCRGSALALPYADERFDMCYSVEAAQHFEDLARFAAEAYRVLRPGGRLAVTTFFMPATGTIDELRPLIATIDNGIDVVVGVDSFRNDLLRAGFDNVCVESLGERVWPGFDAWIAQTEYKDGWGRNWLKAYHRALIDYYLVTADRR